MLNIAAQSSDMELLLQQINLAELLFGDMQLVCCSCRTLPFIVMFDMRTRHGDCGPTACLSPFLAGVNLARHMSWAIPHA